MLLFAASGLFSFALDRPPHRAYDGNYIERSVAVVAPRLYERKRNMIHRKKPVMLNTRLICIAIICIAIPISIIGFSWSRNSALLLTEQTIHRSETRAKQGARVLSLVMDNVDLLYMSLVTSDALVDYANILDGAFLEHETAPYQSLPRTVEYTKSKGALRNLLMTQANSLDAINSIYYYDAPKNVVMSYRWLDTTIERFFDLLWLQETNMVDKSTTILPVRTIKPSAFEEYDVLSIVYKPLTSAIKTPVYLVFNLDAQILHNNYLTNPEYGEEDGVLILDDSGRILMASQGGRLLDSELASEIYGGYISQLNQQPGKTLSADGMLISSSAVDSINWRVITFSSSLSLQSQLFRSSALIVAVIVLVIALLICLVLFIAKQTSYPARIILRSAKDDMPKLPRLLRDTNMAHVENWVQESQAAMCYHFWNSAILGSVPNKSRGYQPRFSEHFMLALTDVFSSEDLPKNRANHDRMLMLERLEAMYGDRNAEIIMMNNNTLLLIIPCARDEINQASGLLADRHRSIVQDMESISLLAIGGWCETLADVKENWMRAVIMLRYQRLSGSTQNRYDMQVENYASGQGLRMWEMSNQLSLNLRQEMWNEALVTLENIRVELKSAAQSMDYLHIRHHMIYTLSLTLEHYFRSGTKDSVSQNIYSQALNEDNVDVVILRCTELVNAMAGGESAMSEQPENNEYVKQLLNMLEHSCDSTMSLSSVAERLGLSSVYLGKIFKRVTGVNYVQYLTDLRMEKARELLLQDNMRIQEIAEQLGYSQSHYFSKVFKQTTGMSPTEYVKKFRGGVTNFSL